MSETRYAFGEDEVAGCKCPASAAGYHPTSGGVSQQFATRFDWIIHEEMDISGLNGVVSEDTAKEAWEMTIQFMKNAENVEQVRLGVKIAEKLNWEINE